MCIGQFSYCCDKIPGAGAGKQLKKGSACLGSQFEGTVNQGRGGALSIMATGALSGG